MSKKKISKKKQNTQWTPEDVRAILINPIYAGIPPYPQIIPDEQWITNQVETIDVDREDVQQYFTDMLSWLRKSFDEVTSPACIDPSRINDDEWIRAHCDQIKQQGTRETMVALLQELRGQAHV